MKVLDIQEIEQVSGSASMLGVGGVAGGFAMMGAGFAIGIFCPAVLLIAVGAMIMGGNGAVIVGAGALIVDYFSY